VLDEHLEDLAQRGPSGGRFARVGGFLLESPKLDERRLAVGAVRVHLLPNAALVDVAEPDTSSARHSALLLRHLASYRRGRGGFATRMTGASIEPEIRTVPRGCDTGAASAQGAPSRSVCLT
jgi:hypothetical protein